MGPPVLSHPDHSTDLVPFDHHLLGSVKDAIRGCHFTDDNKLKQSFRDVLRIRGTEPYNTGLKRLTQRWQKCVGNDEDFVGK
jgi:hypothetical protein